MTQAATLAQLASSGALYADTSGNVGIGTTTTTTYKLNINSNGNNLLLDNSGGGQFTNINFASVGAVKANAYWDQTNTYFVFGTDVSAPVLFKTIGAERARIEANGSFCVGVAGNYSNGTIVGKHSTAGFFTFRSDSGLAASTSWGHLYGTSGTNTVANISIYGNGSIQNATGSYGAYSDIKLKENIVDATPKLDDLMQVKIRNYNLKNGYEQQKQIGVIAQELEEIFPSMIEEAPDRDAEGNDLGTNTKAVKYSVFVPILIKALQELKAELDVCKAEIAALKGV